MLVQLVGVACEQHTFAGSTCTLLHMPAQAQSRRAALHLSSAARCASERHFLPGIARTFADAACEGTKKCGFTAPVEARGAADVAAEAPRSRSHQSACFRSIFDDDGWFRDFFTLKT